jgi:2-polyprenyl-3-methyl-5-hydroxy-6-metoxy-1,4-benzoquinol methylase
MKNSDAFNSHAQEISSGDRFAFGDNWARFLEVLDESRIDQAVQSLKKMLETDSLEGKTFLDIGSGSGLFSLAAKRLGARVFSFDYDPQSVACTQELKQRYFKNDTDWQIQTGSVLDHDYLLRLGQFDIVYSWGVLHHTGSMWSALANVHDCVKSNGILFIALYNNQGVASKVWWKIKKAYVSLPNSLRWLILIPCYVALWGPSTVRDFLVFRPFNKWRNYVANRGMSPHRDVVDWVGGFPFEVAKPEEVFDFYKKQSYDLLKMTTCAGRLGCNEFVFRRSS